MAKLFSAAAITLALASFGCRAASSNCGACCPPGAIASDEVSVSDQTAAAQSETQRRYSYSPNGAMQAGGGTANGNRQPESAYNARQWRADRKVIGF